MGSSSSSPSSSQDIEYQSAGQRKRVLEVLIRNGNKQDFYGVFGFDCYSCPSRQEVGKKFREKSRHHHPDKNLPEDKELCEGIMNSLGLARDTLCDPAAKRRYDRDLRAMRAESSGWDWFHWGITRVANFTLIAGGCVGVVVTGGASLLGGAALAAGIKGTLAVYKDDNVELSEWAGDVAEGAVQGLAAGVAATAAAGYVAASAAGIRAGAAVGAAAGAASHAAGDAVKLARGKKTIDEVVSTDNLKDLAGDMLLGAVVGGLASKAPKANWSDEVMHAAKGAQAATRLAGGYAGIAGGAAAVLRDARRPHRFASRQTLTFGRSLKFLRCTKGAMTHIGPRVMRIFANMRDRADGLKGVLQQQLNDYRGASSFTCLKALTCESYLYKEIEDCLQKDDSRLQEYAGFIYNAKEEMKELAEVNGVFNGIVWRGCHFSDSSLRTMKEVGRVVTFPNFLHCSKNKDVALYEFAFNTMLEIDCAGEGVTYAVDISGISAHPTEEEVLIYPYSGFKVLGYEVKNGITLIRLQTFDTLLAERTFAVRVGASAD